MTKIEKLPTIGESYSIKTAKQGRLGNIHHQGQTPTSSGFATKKGYWRKTSNIFKNIDIYINRLKKFNKLTEAEKVIIAEYQRFGCKSFNDVFSLKLARKIQGINLRYAKKYGDKYVNCNLKVNK